jgi:phosphatidylglycerophosphatase A
VNVALSPRARLLITSFGLGHMRPFPGTWGSLPPCVVAGALMAAGCGPAGGTGAWWLYHGVLALIAIAFCVICVRHGDGAETAFGKKDPSSVVADETAGMSLALMFIPAHAVSGTPKAALAILVAFVLFRIFDIIKPWPCRQIQSVPGGWGILLDDLLAGVYALICTQLVTRTLM